MTSPVFSVVVCTYNGTGTIDSCLRSLADQSFDEPYEVIVVNDGSTDGTREAVTSVESDRIRLVEHETNRGLSAARNTGWQSAKGTYVAYIDDDAVAPSDWLQSLYEGYQTDEEVDGFGGYPAVYGDNPVGRYEVARTEVVYGPNAERADGAGGMNMSFRREVLAEVGGFDERFTHIGDDADLNRRLTEAGYTLLVDTSVRVEHMFPTTVADFGRKQFKRGLGPVLTNEKYGEPPLRSMVLGGVVYALAIPYVVLLATRYHRRSPESELPLFCLLTYLDEVLTRLGVLYFWWHRR